MTIPANYLRAAKMAIDLARQCERDADLYDADWRKQMLSEAKRHRARARGYLTTRAGLFFTLEELIEEDIV